MSLASLPVELLLHVQLYALSPALPVINKHIHAVFRGAPNLYRVRYLMLRHDQPHTISRALLYPLCTPQVLLLLLERSKPSATVPPSLPRRFFHNLRDRRPSTGWTENSDPLPILRVLFSCPRIAKPDANVHHALAYAVAADFDALVTFLLSHGADPRRSSGRAISIAIALNSVKLVRLLCERRDDPKDKPSFVGKGKKRKLEDRIDTTRDSVFLREAAQLKAKEVAEYFLSKRVTADMQTLQLLAKMGLG